MWLIIDGYNLLLSSLLFKINYQEDMSIYRDRLIDLLAEYKMMKNIPITLVFDGAEKGLNSQRKEAYSGLEIIYSRGDESADDVIRRLVKRGKDASVVVTSDRELRSSIEKYGAETIYVSEFVEKLKNIIDVNNNDLTQKERDDCYNNEWLDNTKKKGNPRRLSKTERKKRIKINKLG